MYLLLHRTLTRNNMEHDFWEIIKTRRSCRKFQDRQISHVELDAVLEAETYAPSAGGRQSAFIVAVQNKEQRKKLAAMNAAVIGSKSNPFYDAPTYVLVFAPSNAHTAIEDGTCVLENMTLAAHALNLGSCWIHREKEMFTTDEGKKMIRSWGLPDGLMGIGALALGYPDGKPAPAVTRKEGYYRIIR